MSFDLVRKIKAGFLSKVKSIFRKRLLRIEMKGRRHSLAPAFSLPIVFPLLPSSPCDIARNAFGALKLFDTAADLSIHNVSRKEAASTLTLC